MQSLDTRGPEQHPESANVELSREVCAETRTYVTGTMTPEPLSAVDRCDRCGAQAYVRVTMAAGELLFCAHHGREYTPKLEELRATIVSEYSRLAEEQPTQAASAGIEA
jgi:hypothetical protein